MYYRQPPVCGFARGGSFKGQQLFLSGQHQSDVDRIWQRGIPEHTAFERIVVFCHRGIQIGQRSGVCPVFAAIVLQVVLVLRPKQAAVLAVPDLVGHEDLVGTAGQRIVVNAVIEEQSGSAAVDQPLQGCRGDPLRIRQRKDIQYIDIELRLSWEHTLIIGMQK